MQIPISIVINLKSGHHGQGHECEIELIAGTLAQAGFEVNVFSTTKQQDLNLCISQAVQRHLAYPIEMRGLIVAAGGDGTINAVTQAMLNSKITLGILPLGTFNYVARALNIPLDLPSAVQNLMTGIEQPIHIGQVNGHIYLNNASIGLYPTMIEEREYFNQRLGRFPLVAYLSGASVLLKSYRNYRLSIQLDGKDFPIQSPMVFFGNNQLQLEDLKLQLADCAAQGKLAGVAIGNVNRWQLLKLVVKLFTGEFEQAEDVSGFCAEHVNISSRSRQMKVALDGEIKKLTVPLCFSVLHHAVEVRVPHAITSV